MENDRLRLALPLVTRRKTRRKARFDKPEPLTGQCAAQRVITVKHLTHSVPAFDQTIGCKLPAVPLNQVFNSNSYVLFLFESRDCDLILMHYY